MDINSPINTQNLSASSRLAENTLNLKIGQQLDAKVIGADIQAAKNAIALTLGDKNITVQSNQPIRPSPGQDLKIQVTQVAPVIEFKVLDSLPELKTQAAELRLKLISTARDGGSAASGKEPMRPTSQATQPLDAKIISITGNKIQLEVFQPGNNQAALINIERTQLANAPSDLKAGQNLNLEIIKTGTTPEFKIIPAANNIPEAKIAEFIKQFLPRHEASPIFLNQLTKDLPQLMKNESVPQALKDIAAKIVRNLPPKEQLISSRGLKQSIVNSGLFLEAKLSPAMTQAELIKELPQLIKNASVPQSLQRIASEILQSLTQKEPLLNNPAVADTKPISEAELTSLKLKSAGKFLPTISW